VSYGAKTGVTRAPAESTKQFAARQKRSSSRFRKIGVLGSLVVCFQTNISIGRSDSHQSLMPRPNKRLKLAGGDRINGIGVLCPWRGTDFVLHPCARERVARSLSAIR